MSLVQRYDITEDHIALWFDAVISTSTFLNDNFDLYQGDPGDQATPPENPISNPFDPIDVAEDYHSTHRILYLYWNVDLEEQTWYTLVISGLRAVYNNELLDTVTIPFFVGEIVGGPTAGGSDNPITREPTDVEDYSIKEAPFTTDWGLGSIPNIGSDATPSTDPSFTGPIDYIVPTPLEAWYLSESANKGIIDIFYKADVTPSDVTQANYKVQYKSLATQEGTILLPWTTVTDTRITQPSSKHVRIEMPSQNTSTVVYGADLTDEEALDVIFYLSETKYRIIIPRRLADENYFMLTELDPMLMDPEFVLNYIPDANLVEIAELIHWYSKEILSWGEDFNPVYLQDFLLASVMCDLSKTYAFGGGLTGSSSADEFTLGDLRVSTEASTGLGNGGGVGNDTRTWCELAELYRKRILGSKVGMKVVVEGSNYVNPIPCRKLRSID